ncbi:OmpA family protein [Vibrio harveyi]|nr:OmpA family protein [Vibrio harveyi]
MSNASSNIIIVKKRRIKGDDEHHGGAWKVAFADFAIAMMAFFMVLWIMEIASQEEREEIQYMLRQSTLFNSMDNVFDMRNSPFPIDFEGEASPFENPVTSHLTGSNKLGSALHEQVPQGEVGSNAGRGDELLSMLSGEYLNTAQLSMLSNQLEHLADEMGVTENLSLEIVPQGLRIQIQDSTHHLMFKRGSAWMTPYFEDVLYALAPVLGKIKNRLIISGHTDSTQFQTTQYSNWELSGERALKARQVLVGAGVPKQNVIQVAAMSDRMLIDQADPHNGKNRRIEIMVLTQAAEQQLSLLFGHKSDTQPGVAVQAAKQFATHNQPVSRLEKMTL